MKNKILGLLLVVASIATLIYLSKTKESPLRGDNIQEKRVVKTLKIEPKDMDIYVKSFGTVESNEDLDFISSVAADIIFKNKNLEEGKFIKKGELLLKFDQREYLLNIKNIEANILQAKASKKDLEVELKNTKTLLRIEKQRLKLDEKNYKRYERLGKQISVSELEKFKNIVLSRENSLQTIQSKLETLPFKIKSQEANIEALEAKRDIAKISLEDCSIYMPFDGIVYGINIEKNEYIAKGVKLFKAYNSNKMQIKVELSVSQLSKFKDIYNLENIEAKFYSSSLNRYFKGAFFNLSKNINKDTRTVELIFKIEEPIFKGIFLEANILANSLKSVITIPKTSYINGKVYLEKDEKLHFKKVEVISENEDSYIVKGLDIGENLIVSTIADAIEGMKLKAIK